MINFSSLLSPLDNDIMQYNYIQRYLNHVQKLFYLINLMCIPIRFILIIVHQPKINFYLSKKNTRKTTSIMALCSLSSSAPLSSSSPPSPLSATRQTTSIMALCSAPDFECRILLQEKVAFFWKIAARFFRLMIW